MTATKITGIHPRAQRFPPQLDKIAAKRYRRPSAARKPVQEMIHFKLADCNFLIEGDSEIDQQFPSEIFRDVPDGLAADEVLAVDPVKSSGSDLFQLFEKVTDEIALLVERDQVDDLILQPE